MGGKRSYGDPCGVARALGVIGERWALLVVRELLLGPKRFTDLSRGLPGMSQNVLSQRLRELEESGVIRKRRLGPPASTTGYELTELGQMLDPVLVALARFGSRMPLPASKAGLSVDAFVLALRTTFDPEAAGDLDATYELRLDNDTFQDTFHATIRGGRFEITRGSAVSPDATITTDVATLRGIVFAGHSLAESAVAGHVRIDGDRQAAIHFATVFPRPKPVEQPVKVDR